MSLLRHTGNRISFLVLENKILSFPYFFHSWKKRRKKLLITFYSYYSFDRHFFDMLAFQPLWMYLNKKTNKKNFNFKLGSEGDYFMDTHKTFASHALDI